MKILLVDDSKSARYALRLQLQRHGVEVDTAESAEAALEILKGDLPDAVLMDHMMPGLSGFEALEMIRADARTAHLPVVICTSHEDPEFAAAAQRKGVVAILPKSVAPEKLPAVLAQLKTVLDRSPTQPEDVPRSIPASTPTPTAAPDWQRQIELRIAGLVDERLEARLSNLIAPLLADLNRDLRERLLAEAQQLIAAQIAETRAAIEAPLTTEREATRARFETITGELESAAGRLVAETLPDLVKVEIESERGAIMNLVDQYVREFSPPIPVGPGTAGHAAPLDGELMASIQEIAKREANAAAMATLERCQHLSDGLEQRVRTGHGLLYLAILGAALLGVLSAVLVYVIVR
jgi:CheY-like chemotaxis protein